MFINGEKFITKRYSSGEIKLVKSNLLKYAKNNAVQIIYENNYSMFELLLIINYYINNNIKVDLTLPYLPYQRMDHEGRDELNTVKYVAQIFNSLKLNSITICEPHCDLHYFKNAKEFSYISALRENVFNEVNFDYKNDIVVLTDKGGLKRYGNIADNIVYYNKTRDIETGLIVEHNIVGEIDISKKIIIVDDIISTGDTIMNIIEKLELLGAKEIYILSGHFEKNKFNNRILNKKVVKKVYSTNSLRKNQTKKLKLYNIKDILNGKFN